MITFSHLGHHGRLGNQLFQYALLRGVAAETGHYIALPTQVSARRELPGRHPGDPRDGHLLDAFNIPPDFFREKLVTKRVYREKQYHFDPDVFRVDDGTDFVGYFQTEKYFARVPHLVRAELTPNWGYMSQAKMDLQAWVPIIGGNPVVAIHMRRGDNVHGGGMDPAEHAKSIPCQPLSYYHNAVAWMREHVNRELSYVVLSNTPSDAEWCRVHFPLENAVYRGGPEEDPIHDLAMMMVCDHLIVSNSTLSWWAAWLSERPSKLVTYPTLWFGPALKHKDTRDLWPERWNKVESF